MGFRPHVADKDVELECVEGYSYKQDDLIDELEELSRKYETKYHFNVWSDNDEAYTITINNYKNFIHAVEEEYNIPSNDNRNLSFYNGIRFAEKLGVLKDIPYPESADDYSSPSGILQIYHIARNMRSCIVDDMIEIESF